MMIPLGLPPRSDLSCRSSADSPPPGPEKEAAAASVESEEWFFVWQVSQWSAPSVGSVQ